jgi:hypothetical protein
MRIAVLAFGGSLAAAAMQSLAACDIDVVMAAERRWALTAPNHYTYVVTRATPLIATYKGVPIQKAARVEIKGGAIAAMWYIQDQGRKFRAGRSIPKTVWGHLQFSPGSLFEEVRNSIAWASGSTDHIINCDFDPGTGLLARLHTDSRTLSDSYDVLEVTQFRVLP